MVRNYVRRDVDTVSESQIKLPRAGVQTSYVHSSKIQILCVCLSTIGGQTAGPIMTKFCTHTRIVLGMVPTKKLADLRSGYLAGSELWQRAVSNVRNFGQ